MRAICTFAVLTVAWLALTAGLLAIACLSHAKRPLPPPEPVNLSAEESPTIPAWQRAPLRQPEALPARRPTVAFRPATAPTPDDEATFRAVFDSLRQALADSDEAALGSLFDLHRLAQELEPFGVFEIAPGGDSPANRDAFVQGMREGMVKALIANSLFRWERTQVRRVQFSVDGREALVTADHRSALLGNRALKMRWWLIRGPADWYVYDMEELDMGLRMSRVAAATIPTVRREFGGSPARLQLAVSALREAMIAIVLRENVAEADEKLQDARGVPLPAPVAAVREMIEAIILMGRGAPEAALKRLDEAERLHPGIPAQKAIRGMVEVQRGHFAEALRNVDLYLAEVGPNSDVLLVRGTALEGLNRIPEAIASYRQALDELPDEVEAIQGLRRVLDNDQKGEIALHVSRTTNPLETYDTVYSQAREDNDTATLDVLKAWLRKAHPNDPRWIRMELNDLIEEGKTAEASTVLRGRLASDLPTDVKQSALDAFLDASIEADRRLEAYSAVPDDYAAAAFRHLADNINHWPIAYPAEPADKVLKLQPDLIALHRKRLPDDPWLLFFEGTVLVNERKLAEAERKFAAAQAKLPPRPKDEEDEDSPLVYWNADRARRARVQCFLDMKKGLRAYTEVGPDADTFIELARAFHWTKDATSLDVLLAAHRKNQPNDRQLLYYAAALLQLRDKHLEASEAFLAFLRESDENAPGRWSAIDHAIRGYLRAKLPAKAQEAVAAIGIDKVPPGLRASVHLANGRAVLAEEIIANEAAKPGGYQRLYYDEDFARLMKLPEFESLCKKYPDARNDPTGGTPG